MLRSSAFIFKTALAVLACLTIVIAAPTALWAQDGEPGQETSQESPPSMTEVAEQEALGAFPSLLDQPNPEDVPAVTLGEIEPGIQEAINRLQEEFSPFLERRQMGFDRSLLDLVADDLTGLWQGTERLLADPQILDVGRVLELSLIGVILALLVVLFLFIDWQTTRAASRMQARIHLDVSLGMTTLVRKAILIGARAVSVLVLILFSFFPIRAIFGAVPWTLLLTDTLVWLLAYRVAVTALVSFLRLHPRSEKAQSRRATLERFGKIALQVTLGFMIALAAIERFNYHDQMAAFVFFWFRFTLAILPVYLLASRKAVLSLLPPEPKSRLARALFGALARNYYLVLLLTVILLAFNAAGYIAAATFFLTRGYALLVAATLWFVFLERIHHLVERSFAQAEDDDSPPSPLLRDLQHWMVFAGTFVVIMVGLKFLRLYDPIIALLTPPLLTIGELHISLYNLLNVSLIILGFWLSIRLFKSILNAKVYPAFEVEIGVAYATNTLINYFLFVVAFVLCLVALGVPLSAVMVVMASLGVGIGFGLQNIAENLISGFILLFGRAVKKGDFVTINELYGRVEAVGARSVVVRTPDNYSMLVPSKEIVSGRIINWTFQDDVVRVHLPIGVSYDSDPTEVKEILLATAKKHPDILQEPAPDVWINGFGDSSVEFDLLVYFDCRTTNERTLRGKFNFLLWEAFKEADIQIPFPQRDLHLRSVGDGDEMPQAWFPSKKENGPPHSSRKSQDTKKTEQSG